ncbi:MAG: VOC family protein [Acidimicrobiia bacterium]|nr:VOC family protein [Acidimicrobiia bacterium]
MPERTGYAHGTPNWVDLATSDLEGAKAFYGTVFGWESEDMLAEGGNYTMFRKDGKSVAGMGTLPDELAAAGVPPMWNTYIAVDNVDAAMAKATEAGGGVTMEAMDIKGSGRMAFVTDPTGASIGLWQDAGFFGAGLVNEPGAFVWSELITDDTPAAQEFYAAALGLSAKTMEGASGPYTFFFVDGVKNPVAGMLPKNENMGSFPNYWGTYFAVDDCEGCLETVEANGGKVIMQPMDIPDFGRMAVIQDPQGATMSVIKLSGPQE